jgi:glycerol uptake facilitator-like aquaporin
MKLKALVMEFIGTMLLSAAIIGAGFMALTKTQDPLMALVINGFSAAAVLAVIIRLGAKISGAHYNPAVTLSLLLSKKIDGVTALLYFIAQTAGAVAGAVLANTLYHQYGTKFFPISKAVMSSQYLLISEVLSTAVLVWVVLRNASNANKVATFVPLWIFSAYFFTSSSTFANPAATIGRIFTQSSAGIAPASALRFIAAQFVGALIGWLLYSYLSSESTSSTSSGDDAGLEGEFSADPVL